MHLLPVLFLLSDACIDPLVVKLPPHAASLVVDGLITDAPGPYQVKLFYANLDTATLKRPKFEGGATVWIIDDSGQSELLTEVDTAKGTYQTSTAGIRGQIGKSYYLKIVTKDQTEYQSKPQILSPAGEIDRLYVEYKRNAASVLHGKKLVDAFSILVDAHGPPEGPNFFRWRWKGTYKGITFPMLRTIPNTWPPVPDPEVCSGYITDGVFIFKRRECTCCICWTNEIGSNAVVSDNSFFGDQAFSRVEVARLPITFQRFFEKYYIEVEQSSVSKEVYNFWKLAQAQQRGTNNLFQPNTVKVKGNMICVTDPDKELLGVFSVSAITKKTLFIKKEEVLLPIPPLDTIPYNCIESLQGTGTTTKKPDFW